MDFVFLVVAFMVVITGGVERSLVVALDLMAEEEVIVLTSCVDDIVTLRSCVLRCGKSVISLSSMIYGVN